MEWSVLINGEKWIHCRGGLKEVRRTFEQNKELFKQKGGRIETYVYNSGRYKVKKYRVENGKLILE